MKNLKIRVNSEVENKEVQGAFKILGGSWSKHVNADHYDKEFLYLTNGVIEYDDLLSEFLSVDECKEITLPELRDLVVLKRNKVRQSHRTASEIADSALKHIRERAETYDQPTGERSAAQTAKAFNAITGKDITESEVWLLLQLLKDVRQWSREDYHQDSAEDCIAYAALKAESLEGGE